MNYYIQGNKDKADQIKAAFEAKGYHTGSRDYGDELFFFFSMNNGHIRAQRIPGCNKDYEACLIDIIKTHPDYKELELPIEPKFKDGDDIKTGNTIETIAEVDYATRSYCCESGRTIWFENQDLWHLAHKPHYDIANFKPFDKVLVRCSNDEEWMIEFYCKYDTLVHTSPHRDYPFMGIGDSYSQCIPFNDDTKHLLGTTDMCDEMYINW